jgi:hypothetical protein
MKPTDFEKKKLESAGTFQFIHNGLELFIVTIKRRILY